MLRTCVGCRVAPALAALAAAIWFNLSVQAAAEIPPWQQPPTTRYSSAARSPVDSDDDRGYLPPSRCESDYDCVSSGSCSGDDCDYAGNGCRPICAPFCGFVFHDDWVRAEALLWWTNGGSIPPLLTTSPLGTPQAEAGVLGQPGTVVLLGNQGLNSDFRAGGRISFGTWLDECDNLGIEFGYLGLGQSVEGLSVNSDQNPILARPFFNVDTGAEDAHLIAYPDFLQGSFMLTSTSSFQAAEFLVRRAIARTCGLRVEMLAGYRFQRLAEGLDIIDTATLVSSQQGIQVFDEFHARNDFNAGEVGIAVLRHACRWSLESSLKLALGNTHSRIDITGSTTTPAGTFPGGLLALPSNMGTYNADRFSAVPELGFTLAYDLTCRLRATVGYTLIYWSNVSRPGDQIDLDVSPSQFPPSTQTSTRPEFVQRTSDFWAQGINVGLDYRF
jgi:hypothetical protein